MLGHVSAHIEIAPVIREFFDESKLASVSRLLVDPDARGRGVGRALLDHVVSETRQLGLLPVLDVGRELVDAIRLYERCGWERMGEAEFPYKDGLDLKQARSFVYQGPDAV